MWISYVGGRRWVDSPLDKEDNKRRWAISKILSDKEAKEAAEKAARGICPKHHILKNMNGSCDLCM